MEKTELNRRFCWARFVCILLISAFCWTGCGAPSQNSDTQARQEYEKIKAKLAGAQSASLVAIVRGDEYVDDTKYTVDIKDAKHYRAECSSSRVVADGESVYTVDDSEKYYDRNAIGDESGFGLFELWGFPAMESKDYQGKLESYSFAKLNGEKILRRKIGSEDDQVNVFYSLKTGLPLGYRHEQSIAFAGGYVVEAKYRQVELNPKLNKSLFVFSKPKGYRFMNDRLENVTFRIGEKFPTPAISFIGTRYRSIEDMAKLNKAVLVIFWSHG